MWARARRPWWTGPYALAAARGDPRINVGEFISRPDPAANSRWIADYHRCHQFHLFYYHYYYYCYFYFVDFFFFFIYLFYFISIFRSGRPIDDRVGNPKRHGRRVSLRVRWLSLNEESLCHLNAADPSNKSIVSEWVTERKRKRKRKKRGGWGFRISCQLLPLDDAVRHFASPISPASPTNCLLTTANK